jgi:NADPH-dependent curcumin reductase CurA
MLSVLGVNGLTAYFGMTEIAKPLEGETVFVSAAAGGVGSIAGQIARKLGARVIGSAGGERKCAWARDVARFDACIDYRAEDMRERLGALAPDGIDVVFDNVGGATLEAALDHIAPHARVVLCGSISSGYRNDAYGRGPSNYMQLAFKRARMEGFIFLDFVAQFPQALYRMLAWVQAGDIRYEETISPGLETAPAALAGLFEGRNLGKQLVQVCSSQSD